MQVVNKKMCVIVILVLVIIESCTLFLMYKSFSNKNTNLDEVNLNINNSNMFAIMLEQEDGTYKEDTTNTWPTNYEFNTNMSGCIDQNGNKLDGVLSYDSANNIATVDTTNTSYCYLYFNIPSCDSGDILGKCLITSPTNGLIVQKKSGEMYRYQGIQGEVDNYICFGTTNSENCTENTDAYMYRIIGINENSQLKLIKKEALNKTMQWWSDNATDIAWPNSLIYEAINGSEFLTNSTYVPTGWENKIATHSWKYGALELGDQTETGLEVFEKENSWSDTVNSKIGLMYVYDYYLAYNDTINAQHNSLKSGWFYIANNDTSVPGQGFEYTMSRWEYTGKKSAFFASVNLPIMKGEIVADGIDYNLAIRPVFYLNNNIFYISGTGTIDDPFIIS